MVQAEGLMLFPGELLTQRGWGYSFQPPIKGDGLWGQLPALSWGRVTKWLGSALAEDRLCPSLNTRRVSRTFQERSDLTKVLNDSLNFCTWRNINYCISAMGQTISWDLSLCHLTQPQKNLVNEVDQIPVFPCEATEMGSCFCQNHAMSLIPKSWTLTQRLAFSVRDALFASSGIWWFFRGNQVLLFKNFLFNLNSS